MELKRLTKVAVFAVMSALIFSAARANGTDVIIENARMKLVIGADAVVKSLKVKGCAEELLAAGENVSAFSVVQDRPFNNEVKLLWPNRRTEYRANRLCREGDDLLVGFEQVSYGARIRLTEQDEYVLFELVDFPLGERGCNGLTMTYPPVDVMKILVLPVKNRQHFGSWLNVCWDAQTAVSVFAAEPMTSIDGAERRGFHLMSAESHREQGLVGAKAVLLVSPTQTFLDDMDAAEERLGLSRGVRARRGTFVHDSSYWTANIDPSDVDAHIALARRAGLKKMLVYHTAVCAHSGDYSAIADYTPDSSRYPKGYDSIREMLAKIKAAGITPGLHVLQTFIGFDTHYVTPVADSRLNLKTHFTLSRPLDETFSGELYVQENPIGSPTNAASRILAFGGELVSYESFTTRYPYKFTGLGRGAKKTTPVPHPRGQIGGVLDVCEFGGRSCYIDQKSDLQDEIAEKIAKIYDCGFEFLYFDGSEGVNVPQGLHVASAQERVLRRLGCPPLYTEGAAKSHFGWHHQAGGNAFDVFAPEVFKQMIVRWPLQGADVLAEDFTQVDFGWGALVAPRKDGKRKTIGTQLDMWEFGLSKAVACGCSSTVKLSPKLVAAHPRGKDLVEVIRRWEDVRAKGVLSDEQKTAIRCPDRQFHLYVNGHGEYELHEFELLVPEDASGLRAFLFERKGRRLIAYWHTSGEGIYRLPIGVNGEDVTLLASDVKYFETPLAKERVCAAFSAVSSVREERPVLGYNADFWHFLAYANTSSNAFTDEWMRTNNMNNVMHTWLGRYSADRSGARRYLDDVLQGAVNRFVMNVNCQRAGFDSKTIEPYWKSERAPSGYEDHLIEASRNLQRAGTDLYAVWIKGCREKGVSPWLSVRMNDMHNLNIPGCPSISDFWRNHPEYRRMRGETPTNVWSWAAQSLDFAHPEVRGRMLAFIRECLSRYDIDGVELDWTRFVWVFAEGEERQNAPLLTEFMREVRKAAEESAARLGHPVRISCRLVSDPDIELSLGRDLGLWAKEGLMDEVAVGNHYMCADYEIPVVRWRKLLGPYVRIAGYVDNGLAFADGGVKRRDMTYEEYLGWADVMRARGCSDVLLFNLFCSSRLDEAWQRMVTSGLGSDVAAVSARRYPLSHCDLGFIKRGEGGRPRRMPFELNRRFDCSIPVGSVSPGESAELILAFSATDGKWPAVSVNGCPAGTVSSAEEPPASAACRYRIGQGVVRSGQNEVCISPEAGCTLVYVAIRLQPTGRCP